MDLGHVVFGYSCCLVAGVGFAVNYLPVKRVDTGDGVFFAASMSIGIVLVGVATGFAAGSREEMVFPKFEPLAAVGGAIWMLGNLMCPYIIRMVGLGLGLTVWDLSNMITGWFTGFFGWFGVQREQVARPALNCVGVGLAAFSLVFFSLAASADKAGAGAREVKEVESPGPGLGERSPTESTADSSGTHAAVSPADMEAAKEVSVNWEDVEKPVAPGLSLAPGLALAMIVGVLFGTTIDLPTDLAQGELGPDHSPRILDYVSSHFIGIFAMAVLALLVYVAVMGRRMQSWALTWLSPSSRACLVSLG